MSQIHIEAHDLELEWWRVEWPEGWGKFYPYNVRDVPRCQVSAVGKTLWGAIYNWLYNYAGVDERWLEKEYRL